jgi:hypothetical protein
VSPYGAHRRLQQLPQPLQITPSTLPEQFDAPSTGAPHVPKPPSFALHAPEQQSPARLHTSPVCEQNELLMLHTPSLHSCEQHWSLLSHGLPLVRHVVFSGTHLF